MTPGTTPRNSGPTFAATFQRAFTPAALVGIAALVLAGGWGAVTRPETGMPLISVAVAGGVAVVAAVVALARRRRPATLVSIAAQLLALLGSAVVFGALRGSLPGVLAALAGVVFFVMAVASTVLHADGAGARSTSRFD